jgi:type IV pilus assembly protein PilM
MAFDLKNTLSFLKRETNIGGEDRSVGIDIGSSTIKVVELKKTNTSLALSTYGELQLGPYSDQATGTTVKLDHDQTVKALVDVMRESGVVSKSGVLAVPLASSFLTTISLNAKDSSEVAKMIPVEARKYIPIPLNEVALDWYELEKNGKDANSEQSEVLLAAIQNESLTHYQRLLSAVGMHAQPTEIEAFSAIRAVVEDLEAPSIIMDLGASMSKLYIIKGTTLQKLHRVKVGGEQITHELAELKKISFEEAELIKRESLVGGEYSREVKTSIQAVMERPFREFQRVVQQYQTQHGINFDRIYVIGGTAQLDQVSDYIKEVLAIEPQMYNPFSKVAYPAFMEDVLEDLGSSFAVATGAALRPYLE